jgi:hypothetical protein
VAKMMKKAVRKVPAKKAARLTAGVFALRSMYAKRYFEPRRKARPKRPNAASLVVSGRCLKESVERERERECQ